MDEARANKIDAFTKWVQGSEAIQYAILNNPFSPPLWARETIIERIEPWATEYDELEREHPDHWACPDCGGDPDPEFYQPTQKLIDLDARLDALKTAAFREIPNPAYDAERAEAYWEKRRNPYNATQIKVGQSYNPEFSRHIVVGDQDDPS